MIYIKLILFIMFLSYFICINDSNQLLKLVKCEASKDVAHVAIVTNKYYNSGT